MIAQLTGTVIAAGATHVVLDLNGFGVKALCTPATASNTISLLSKALLEVASISCASTFNNTSESELVLIWRRS